MSVLDGVLGAIIETIVIVVVLTALYPTFTDAIANFTGAPAAVSALFGLLPLLVGIFAGYNLIKRAMHMQATG